MPRVKIDYVVSFSSEDPEHRAANLLAGEVSRKRWVCSKGEPSCSVVLQLERAVEITSVQIGAYHAALVEVLVGLSERPNDPYQVLVPSCVFVPPPQSRRETGVARVRSFARDALAADTRGRRYDRVRVVCSQPYNKHCQYGLSFIHINEPESPAPTAAAPAPAPAVPARLLALDTHSSDEEEFRPGELFAQRLQPPAPAAAATNTGAQIRQANATALQNISDPSTKLTKTPINKAGGWRTRPGGSTAPASAPAPPRHRQRDGLVYTSDDERPHDKIDRVVNRHKDEKHKEDHQRRTQTEDKKKDKLNGSTSESTKKMNDSSSGSRTGTTDRAAGEQGAGGATKTDTRKRKRVDDDDKPDSLAGLDIGPVCENEADILRGVTLVLSGYAGAQRADLRVTALELGARYSPDWTPRCTHLICAFPNTPKLRTVRAADARAGVATAAWLEACAAQRRRLPWQWYATLPAERLPEQTLPTHAPKRPSSSKEDSEDTDVEEELDAPETAARPARSPAPRSPRAPPHEELAALETDSDLTDDPDATGCGRAPGPETIDRDKALPSFFAGYTFVLSPRAGARALLARYVRAYGGLVLQEDEVLEDSEIDFVVSSGDSGGGGGGGGGGAGAGGRRVRPAWVWRCHRERRLADVA